MTPSLFLSLSLFLSVSPFLSAEETNGEGVDLLCAHTVPPSACLPNPTPAPASAPPPRLNCTSPVLCQTLGATRRPQQPEHPPGRRELTGTALFFSLHWSLFFGFCCLLLCVIYYSSCDLIFIFFSLFFYFFLFLESFHLFFIILLSCLCKTFGLLICLVYFLVVFFCTLLKARTRWVHLAGL